MTPDVSKKLHAHLRTSNDLCWPKLQVFEAGAVVVWFVFFANHSPPEQSYVYVIGYFHPLNGIM